MQSFLVAQNPQLVPAAARSLVSAGDVAAAVQTVSHSIVNAASARALACVAAAQAAIAAAIWAAVACSLAPMDYHD